MEWLQNTLGIRPVFNSDEVYWSKNVNDALARETESGGMILSFLILDSLNAHFTGNWGEISGKIRQKDDMVLKGYLSGNKSGTLISKFSNEYHSLIILTFSRFTKTKIMFESEFENYTRSKEIYIDPFSR